MLDHVTQKALRLDFCVVGIDPFKLSTMGHSICEKILLNHLGKCNDLGQYDL